MQQAGISHGTEPKWQLSKTEQWEGTFKRESPGPFISVKQGKTRLISAITGAGFEKKQTKTLFCDVATD